MQAIIMAAGKGSRLGEFTDGKPKSFVEIKGKKLIEYNLNMLKKYNIDNIIIVTGYCCEAFEEFTKDMSGIRLVYNPFYEMVNVIGSFYFGMEYLNDDFIYMHADTLCDPVIFEKLLSNSADVVLPVDFSSCDEEAMKVRKENGKIVQITKQMSVAEAEGEFIGIAKFKKNVIPYLKMYSKEVLKEKRFNEYFESAIQKIIDNCKFNIDTISTDNQFWAEIDFLEDYERAVENIPNSILSL